MNIPTNLRTRVINWAAELVLSRTNKPVTFLEIGTMFRLTEGASTLLLARWAKKAGPGSKVISIDADPTHIAAAREHLKNFDPSLPDLVDFRTGMSLDVIPDVLKDYQSFDLLWLDGGGHPETCLREFEHLFPLMAEHGICLEDDASPMKPSEAYPFQRPLGKATLIHPMVALSAYLADRPKVIAHSKAPEAWTSPVFSHIPDGQLLDLKGRSVYFDLANDEYRSGVFVAAYQPFNLPMLRDSFFRKHTLRIARLLRLR